MKDIIRYGMSVVGSNLGFVKRENIDGLIEKIKIKMERHFGPTTGYVDDNQLNIILANAAENLGRSNFFWWRIEYGARIYSFLGMNQEAKSLYELFEIERKRSKARPRSLCEMIRTNNE